MDHAEHPPEIMNIDTTLTKEEIDSLRKKIDSFGTVNLVAIEELEELRKRHLLIGS
jgi:chromosome segregation ATPase